MIAFPPAGRVLNRQSSGDSYPDCELPQQPGRREGRRTVQSTPGPTVPPRTSNTGPPASTTEIPCLYPPLVPSQQEKIKSPNKQLPVARYLTPFPSAGWVNPYGG